MEKKISKFIEYENQGKVVCGQSTNKIVRDI